jgi:U3 small nucleolar RNA-associated protein 23
MRGKRSKQYRKLMHAYALTFGFRAPYQVMLSSTIIRDAARFKMQLGHMLSNTLHGEIKPMITQCCIRHLYNAVPEPGHERDKERR